MESWSRHGAVPPLQRTGVGEGMPHAAAAKRAQSTPPKCSVDSTLDRYSPVHSELAGVCVCVYVCVLQVVGVAGGVPEAGVGWLLQGGRAEQDSLSTAGAAAQRWESC